MSTGWGRDGRRCWWWQPFRVRRRLRCCGGAGRAGIGRARRRLRGSHGEGGAHLPAAADTSRHGAARQEAPAQRTAACPVHPVVFFFGRDKSRGKPVDAEHAGRAKRLRSAAAEAQSGGGQQQQPRFDQRCEAESAARPVRRGPHPDHRGSGLWYSALPEHQMALITSGGHLEETGMKMIVTQRSSDVVVGLPYGTMSRTTPYALAACHISLSLSR